MNNKLSKIVVEVNKEELKGALNILRENEVGCTNAQRHEYKGYEFFELTLKNIEGNNLSSVELQDVEYLLHDNDIYAHLEDVGEFIAHWEVCDMIELDNRMRALIKEVEGVDVKTIMELEKYKIEVNEEYENCFSINGGEYKVLDDEESDEEFEEYQKQLFEDIGIIGSVSDWFESEILTYCLDEEGIKRILREDFKTYYLDSCDMDEEELKEECESWGVEDLEDLLDARVEDVESQGLYNYFSFNFGEEYTNNLFKDYIDEDEVIERIKKYDGRGSSLAPYDHDEREQQVGNEYYYIYRVN